MIRIIFFILVSIFAINPAFASDHQSKSLISVSGEAKISVEPDEAYISLTVETTDKDLKKAQKENDKISADLLNLAKNKLRIDEKDIKTSYININPVYSYNECGQKRCTTPVFTHFENKKGFSIKLKDISKLQQLLEELIAINVTKIQNVEFKSSQEDELKQQVQIHAAQDAKSQAEKVASALGVSVGTPHRISFNNLSPVAKRGGMVMSSMAMSDSARTIASGEIVISANVYIDFEIEK